MDAHQSQLDNAAEYSKGLEHRIRELERDWPKTLAKSYWLENAVMHLLGLLGKDTAGLYLEHARMADQFATARMEITDKGAGVEFLPMDRLDYDPDYPPNIVKGPDLGKGMP